MYGLEDDRPDTDQFDDKGIIARTAYGEARGEGNFGMHVVVNTIQNRLASGVRWWGHSLRTICLHPWQYSCWNPTDPNRAKMFKVTEDDLQFRAANNLADRALAGSLPDFSVGADSYYDSLIGKPPDWAVGRDPVAIVGHHWLYKLAGR